MQESEIYKNIYFLHIPKTAGRYFYYNIYQNVVDIGGIKEIRPAGSYHQYWLNKIEKETYIVTLLRNPIDHYASLYTHSNLLIEENKYFNERKDVIVNDNLFQKWLIQNKEAISNYQSRSLLQDNTLMEKNELIFFKNVKINEDLLKERINRINLILKSESIFDKTTTLIGNKILKDFKIDKKNVLPKQIYSFKNIYTKKLLSIISEETKEIIKDMARLDLEIYNSSKIWDPREYL